jgi:hypothetical protein
MAALRAGGEEGETRFRWVGWLWLVGWVCVYTRLAFSALLHQPSRSCVSGGPPDRLSPLQPDSTLFLPIKTINPPPPRDTLKAARWQSWVMNVQARSREYNGERRMRYTVMQVGGGEGWGGWG